MSDEPLNVLFLCSHNTCLSIIAEALLNKVGQGRFRAFSAGNAPKGQVNAYVKETLHQVGYDTSEQFSKSWDAFAVPNAPRVDAVITLSDDLKSIPQPIWYSNPVHVHWTFTDPEELDGNEGNRVAGFRRCYGELEQQMLKLAGQHTDNVRGEALVQLLESIKP